jgi:protein SCO1/2
MAQNPSPSARPARTAPYALIGAALAVLLIGTGAFLWLTNTNPARSMIGGPFTLTSGDGVTVTDKDFRGKYMLIYFGYTFCPDICPTSLNTVAEALDRLGAKAERVLPLFITIDPKRDTPDAVKQYAQAFGPRMVGLTGSQAQVDIVAKAYRVYYREHRTGPGPNDYTMDHSSILYLVGPDGNFVAPIRAEQPPEDIAAALRRLVS